MNQQSLLPEIAWPPFPGAQAAMLMSLLKQYDESQWWTQEQVRDAQFGQLSLLAEHAMKTVPFHAERLKAAGFTSGKPMTPEIWRRLPVLTRDEVRDQVELLQASSYPPSFGASTTVYSGGSTGVPVRVTKTHVDGFFWQAAHLREFDWHGIDAGLELANSMGISEEIRTSYMQQPESFKDAGGLVIANWGTPVAILGKTGPMGIFEPHHPLEMQTAFLMKRRPAYMRIMPSALRLLLIHFRDKGLTLDSLQCVWTMSESVDESLRQLCREIFGCPVVSNYTSNETGYIALQCPEGTNFHALSESILLEVIDDSGRPCQPGEVGRVIVTPLHNFAMPLLRYEVGDEAEVGEPCGCGRGLPSLTRIVGRLQDYLTLRSGERKRAALDHYQISGIRAVREFQLVQTRLNHIDLRLVISGELLPAEVVILEGVMRRSFEGHLAWSVVMVDSLPRTRAGKLRQFRSEVQTADKT